MIARLTLLLLLFAPFSLSAQKDWTLITANSFHEHNKPEKKVSLIREMEYRGWVLRDTFYDFEKRLQYQEVDVSPYVNEEGALVYYVTELSPAFPGGAAVQADYFHNTLSDLLAVKGDDVQSTFRVHFLVREDGQIDTVVPVKPPYLDELDDRMQRCVEAVRSMPNWSPGQYKGRPVIVQYLISFSLKT